MLSDKNKVLLKSLAIQSIEYGLKHDKPLSVTLDNQDPELIKHSASFVTLTKNGELRGCIGSLEAHRALIEDVVNNSFSSAFRDYRFSPVTEQELNNLDIILSILSPPQLMEFVSENDLLNQLRPDIDGLIIEDREHRATFLPSVWQSLPQAEQFLTQLKLKAGLNTNYWSPQLQAYRYTTESF